MSKNTATSALRELEQRGHIKITGSGKARRGYVLTSPVFGQKAGKVDEVVNVAGRKRLVNVRAESA